MPTSVHTHPPVHPSILPSISSLAAHSHFAKQSSFPFITSSSRRSFFSISPFSLGASSFFKPFDSNWFLSRPLIRTPPSPPFPVLRLSFIRLPLTVLPPAYLRDPCFSSLFVSRRYHCEFVLPFRSDALSYLWLPRTREREREREREKHEMTPEEGAAETSERT